MKLVGKILGCDVYTDEECPPDKIYFISGKVHLPPRINFDELTKDKKDKIKELIKEVKLSGG